VKKIEAIIQPDKLDKIKEALVGMDIKGMTISEVRGFGRQEGKVEIFRGAKYKIDFLPKIKIEIICKTDACDKIIETIIENARTGEIGDGKIFILPIEETIRIRTGEKGEIAI
jgi:nitrogen regulatory protein P-II 1